MLAPQRGSEVQHHSLRHDQPATEVQIGPHPRGIETQAPHDLAQARQNIPRRDAGPRLGAVEHQAGGAVGLVLRRHGFQGQGHQRPHLGRRRDNVLAQLGIALLRHGGRPDGARRHGFLDLPELSLHQGVDFAPDLAARCRQQTKQTNILTQMVPDGARRHGHGPEAEQTPDPLLHGRTHLAERRIGPCPAAEHGDKQPRRRLLQPFHMPQQLVDPHRHLVPEGGGHRVLPMRPPGDRHIRPPLG